MAGSPQSGPCAPWVNAAQVKDLPWLAQAIAKMQQAGPYVDVDPIVAEAAAAASEILFELSGRTFAGSCGPVTIRPVSRPTDADTRSLGARLSPTGWVNTFGYGTSYGSITPGVATMYASSEPPTIRLPYPVRAITLVKIDGTTIPSTEYELRDHIELVRVRATGATTPTARYGWPVSQIMDLPDTQPGTFSITFTYGADPPSSGVLAARKLAEYLALPQLGDTTRYPTRTVSVARQGVTAQVASTIDILKQGSLGIYEVDAFLLAVNPGRNKRQAIAWSPDIGRQRRQANPSLS